MTISENSESRSLSREALYAARYYLGSRTGLIAIAAIGIGAGTYFNWGWLVAAGIAPMLIGVAPCAAMCALGLCMIGRSRAMPKSDQSSSTAQPPKLIAKAHNKHGKACC